MKKEICKRCVRYRAYYHQRGCDFEKLHYGTCSIHKQDRKENETCEKFFYDKLREERRKAGLFTSLEIAAKSINEMIQIIKEKENDSENKVNEL